MKTFLPGSIVVLAAGLGLVAVPHAAGQFTSLNVELKDWIDLPGLGSNEGNDCWGYVSPSGREYALMGVRAAIVVIEITLPANPQIIATLPHTDCLWGDVKVFDDHCYVVNQCSGGMDVIDLSDVDNGNVVLVQSFTDGGLDSSHNVAIDTTSGFLYLCGANLNGGRLIAYDLADPAAPTFVGELNSDEGANVHDAQIVTYTSGPYAGKQIAFAANGPTGLDIYDVTDKSNMVRLSRTTYLQLSYAHQCWLSEDKQTLYLNDETDGSNGTVVFDVSDLANPAVVNIFSSGVAATDHNEYVRDGFLYEAEYRAGLRITCVADPLNPVPVGWFDTFPDNDDGGFEGVWSVYPFFPSGTVILSDRTRGFFVLDVSAALAAASDCGQAAGDLDGDGVVGIIDFLMLLSAWGPCQAPCPPSCPADLDDDCDVGITDFLLLLTNWG